MPKPTDGRLKTTFVDFQTEVLLGAVEQIAGIYRDDICHGGKSARSITAKEALQLTRRLAAIPNSELFRRDS